MLELDSDNNNRNFDAVIKEIKINEEKESSNAN